MFGAVPDLDHPATKGWLLAMLREATGTMVIESCPDNVDGLWAIEIDGAVTWYSAPEGEALAHALLAAWDAEEVRGG